jgi:hypothetical protein
MMLLVQSASSWPIRIVLPSPTAVCPKQAVPTRRTVRQVTRQVDQGRLGRVVDHRGGLGDGVGLDSLDARPAAEHRLDHRLL